MKDCICITYGTLSQNNIWNALKYGSCYDLVKRCYEREWIDIVVFVKNFDNSLKSSFQITTLKDLKYYLSLCDFIFKKNEIIYLNGGVEEKLIIIKPVASRKE